MTTGRINQVAFLGDIESQDVKHLRDIKRQSNGARSADLWVYKGLFDPYPQRFLNPRRQATLVGRYRMAIYMQFGTRSSL